MAHSELLLCSLTFLFLSFAAPFSFEGSSSTEFRAVLGIFRSLCRICQLLKEIFSLLDRENIGFCSLKLSTNFHPLEPAVNMVIVHVKVMSLEGITIHASVN